MAGISLRVTRRREDDDYDFIWVSYISPRLQEIILKQGVRDQVVLFEDPESGWKLYSAEDIGFSTSKGYYKIPNRLPILGQEASGYKSSMPKVKQLIYKFNKSLYSNSDMDMGDVWVEDRDENNTEGDE